MRIVKRKKKSNYILFVRFYIIYISNILKKKGKYNFIILLKEKFEF